MTSTSHVHYHVAAVQDWGGSQEYGVVWDDKLDLTAARSWRTTWSAPTPGFIRSTPSPQ
jgi:hypothetical protein